MTGAEQNERFLELLDGMASVRRSKNKDYANEADSLANFRMVERAGIPAWIGIWVRLGDKYARVTEQVRKVLAGEEITFAVTSEGFADTGVDGANYFLLMTVAFEEWMDEREKEKDDIFAEIANSPSVVCTPGTTHEDCGVD